MKTLFFPLTSKKNSKGLAPLKIRITLGPADREDISTGKFIDPDLWDVKRKIVSGKSAQADIINKYITACQNKLNKIETDLQDKEQPYNAEIIRNIYLGTHIARYTLLQVLDAHNHAFSQKVGQEGYSKGREYKYLGLKKKLSHFMQQQYKRSDMYIAELNLEFIEAYWHFLTTTGKEIRGYFKEPMDIESASGQITMLKKVARQGFRKQELHINPFDDFKVPPFTKAPKEALTIDEVNQIRFTDKIKTPRLDRVRDRVIIGCFTGLSDSDIQSCTPDMISTDIKGNKWIDKSRIKTRELCIVPLWEPVLQIIEKYKHDPELKAKNRLFPQLSLQRMNTYLRELADLCGITKPLTTHICRHTFADFYINSGGTYENLARILGHSSTKTSRLYGRRNKTSINTEIETVRNNVLDVVHRNQNQQLITLSK